MNYTDYVDAIVKFDKYPNNKIAKPAVYFEGLVGECGEVCLAIQSQPIGYTTTKIHTHLNEIYNEMGDYLWYWTRLGTWLHENIDNNFNIKKIFQNCITETAFNAEYDGIAATALKFVGSSCKVVEAHKKAIRDDNGVITEKRLDVIKTSMKKAMLSLFVLLSLYGMDVHNVLQMNYDKLSDRLEKGTIHGSDDDGSRIK